MATLELVSRWPVDAAAAGVLRRTDPAGGATLVDTVGDIERPFAWASITKLLVAMAVLLAVEEGTISLDEPAGPPGSTVRHLLAHASGLGPDSPVPVATPERMRIYSNIGYEILADVLSEHAHMPFSDYLAGGVLNPLSMSATELIPGSSPASGARGPLHDLLLLAEELLVPTIVSPATLALATTVAFPGLRGVLPGYGRFDPCDWGLGFEVKGDKTPHWTGSRTTPATFGHFGRAGGFLWVDPRTGLACATLSNRDFGPWAVTEWSSLADAVVQDWTVPLSAASGAPAPGAPEASETDRHERETALAEVERRQREAAAQAEVERRQREAAQAEVERRQREAALAEATEVERRQREAAQAEVERRQREAAQAEVERRQREAALAEAAEAERRQREAAQAEVERRQPEAALAEAAEAERRQREAALAEAAEVERRQREAIKAAKAERRNRKALRVEAERRKKKAARVETKRRQREAAEAADVMRRQWAAVQAAEGRRRGAETGVIEAAEAERRQREAAEPERQAVAMAGRSRDVAEALVAEAASVDREAGRQATALVQDSRTGEARADGVHPEEDEESGPFGPGIRPIDFWGVCTP